MKLGLQRSTFLIQLQPYIIQTDGLNCAELNISDLENKLKKLITDRIALNYKRLISNPMVGFKIQDYIYHRKDNLINIRFKMDKLAYTFVNIKHKKMTDHHLYAKVIDYVMSNYTESNKWRDNQNTIIVANDEYDEFEYELDFRLINIMVNIDDGKYKSDKFLASMTETAPKKVKKSGK